MPIFRCSTCEASRRGLTPTPKNLVRGFTVIEMIVTFAIITSLLAATAPSAAFNRREYILSSNQEQLRSLISRAKALTMSGLLRKTGVDQGVDQAEKICGYGITINQDDKTAAIFSSVLTLPGDCPEKADDFFSAGLNFEPLAGTLNTMNFDKALNIKLEAGLANAMNEINPLNVYFLAPDPLTIITTENKEWATITLGLAPSSRQIKINKAGLIDLIYETAQQ
jgi:type II secretory pathway pseudopilin PulG